MSRRSVNGQVVFYAAVFRTFETVKSRTLEAIHSMQKGQLVLLGKSDTWWACCRELEWPRLPRLYKIRPERCHESY